MNKNQTKTFQEKFLASSIGMALALTSGYAYSQESEENTTEEAQESVEKISVVGSRIRNDGFDRALPVEVILADSAISQGIGDVSELLRSSTVAAGSPQATAALSTALIQEGGPGAETISLRGLGANRTLVLLNGRRIGPAGVRGQVSSFDFNVLPLSAVDRLEILKDGASSIYGSDAVAGVVNIMTKKGDGGNVDVSYTQPMESGGEQFRINATYGAANDNGSFRVTADYNLQSELAKGDRDYFQCGNRYAFDRSTGERADFIDPRTGEFQCRDLLWGHVWLYDYQDGATSNIPGTANLIQYDYDGVLGNYIPPLITDPNNPEHLGVPAGWFPVGYDRNSDAVLDYQHPFFGLTSLVPKNERATLFATADYYINDELQVYGEVLLNRRETTINGYRQYWGYIYNSNWDFGFAVDDAAGSSLSEGWTGANWLSPTPISDHSGSKTTVDYHRFVVGLTGDLTDTWYFDMSLQSSRSDGDYLTKVIYNDSIRDQNFATGSCVGTTTSVRGVPCIDIPWLTPDLMRGNVSQELRDFLFGEDIGNTVYKQQSFEAFASGDVMELPAGTVAAAVGIYYQKDEIVDTPGDVTLAGNVWGASTAGITAGDDSTQAVFAEFEVPVLRDAFLAESLDLTLSGRYTDVDSSGDDTTYKVGVNWTIGEGLRFRGARSTSFRSPALFELYLNEQTGSLRQSLADPCVNWGAELEAGNINQRTANNCAADGLAADYAGGAISATTITSGGLGVLAPETSTSNTFGLVYKPTFLENFVFSIDFFDIEIEGEVTNLGGATITFQCYNSENFATEPLCNQFDRDPLDQRITDIRGGYLNIASQTNRGYDVAISYDFETEYGKFDLSAEATVQKEASRQLFSTEEPEDRTGEFGRPEKVANFTVNWMTTNEWNLTWTMRYVGSVSNHFRPFGAVDEYSDSATIRGQEVRLDFNDSGKMYHSLSVAKKLFDINMTFGIANVLDQEPPEVSDFGGTVRREGNSAFYSQYDWLGRRAFLNLSYDF